jgi:hypothetical protein
LLQASFIAYGMLFLWPWVSSILWQRFEPEKALVWTILGGYLLLPPLVKLDFPAVPDLDKVSIPNLCALVFGGLLLKERISFVPASVSGRILMFIFLCSPFATLLSNPDPITVGSQILPGLRLYDSIAAIGNQIFTLIPYFMARHYLGTDSAPQCILTILVTCALAYSLPMLIEARLSPQINIWIYGFFQHDFSQMMRLGGFRPIVFLPHGLWLAFFTFSAAMAALALAKNTPPHLRIRISLITIYLLAMIIICKTAGVLLYTAVCLPILLITSIATTIRVSALLAMVVILFPIFRGAGLIPVEAIVEFAMTFSTDRALSLEFRINNENLLMEHASQRPWFGWGGYGRNHLHDALTGRETTVADGHWIIVLGLYGWVGYVSEFGLLVLPLMLLGRETLGDGRRGLTPACGALALIHAMNLVDLLPNATVIPFTWLSAGALLAQAERLKRERMARSRIAHGLIAPQARTIL